MTFTSRAFVLAKRDIREYDRIYTLYTRDFGKVEAVAVGIKKIKSKLAPHLIPLTLVDCMFVRGRHTDRLIQAVSINQFPKLYSDLRAIILGNFCAELVSQLTKLEARDIRVFELMGTLLESLEQGKPCDASVFMIKLFHALGFGLELSSCVGCRKEAAEEADIRVDPERGGIVCAKCATESACLIQAPTLSMLRSIVRDNDLILGMAMPSNTLQDMRILADRYLRAHLRHPLNSENFFGLTFVQNHQYPQYV